MSNFRTEDVYLEHSKDRKSVTIKNRRGANLENLTALEILELHEKSKELDRMQKNAQLPDRQRLQNKIRNQRKELKNLNIKVQECACIDEFLRLEHPHQFEENTTTLDRVKHLSRSYQQERLVRTNENSAQIHYDIITNIPKDLITDLELQQSEGVTIGKAVASAINKLIDNRDHYKSLTNSYEKKLHDKNSPLRKICDRRLDKIEDLRKQVDYYEEQELWIKSPGTLRMFQQFPKYGVPAQPNQEIKPTEQLRLRHLGAGVLSIVENPNTHQMEYAKHEPDEYGRAWSYRYQKNKWAGRHLRTAIAYDIMCTPVYNLTSGQVMDEIPYKLEGSNRIFKNIDDDVYIWNPYNQTWCFSDSERYYQKHKVSEIVNCPTIQIKELEEALNAAQENKAQEVKTLQEKIDQISEQLKALKC